MVECIVSIKNGCIYIPKKYLQKAGFKPNERVILRVTGHGIAFCKVDLLDDIDDFFNNVDISLQKLFVSKKSNEFKHNHN